MHASEDPASTQHPRKSPRWRRTGTLLALLVASSLYASVAASAQSVTFTPGLTQEFKVPLGVATVEVVAVGGEGQTGTSCRNEPGSNGGAGGSGALVTATIPVTGVKTLYVAFGTGGAAGTGGGAGSCSLAGGAGGGSAEVLAESSTPLVVAGGGGGGGATMGEAEPFEEETNNGGAGANATASLADGGNGVLKNRFFTREEGLGGEGGGAGSGGAAGLTQSIEAWATPADAGARASGGNGATYNNAPSPPFVAAGGGGGAGYYGGGGGGAGNLNGGGGGAGSSYVDEATGVTGIVASGSGHAQAVTLTYTVAAPPKAVIDAPLAGGTYTPGAVVKTEFSCEEGAGGSGIEACVDSGGAPAGSGTLDTSTVGAHTYTVTAKSKDGLAATTTIEYTVSAPAAQVADTPSTPTPKMCMSARHLTIHLARHLALRTGTRILRANVLLAGHLVARLRGPNPVAHVSLVGLPKHAYTVTFFARTSTGSLLTGSAIYHTCVGRRTS